MIYDLNDEPVYSASLALQSNDSQTAEIKVDCATGRYLRGTSATGVTVEAKHELAAGWTNIETTPIDLGSWDGSTEKFLVKFSTSTVSAYGRVQFTLSVGP